jgi:WD40 repeat protein
MALISKSLLGTALLVTASWQPLRADEPMVQGLTLPAGATARLGASRFLNFGRVFSIAFSPDGKLLAAGAWDGSMRVWDVFSGKELHASHEQKTPVHSVAFSPDGKLLATEGKAAAIVLLNPVSGKELHRLASHQAAVTGLAFSPDGNILASRSMDQTIRLWDVASAREIRKLGNQGSSRIGYDSETPLAFGPDGKSIASAILNPGLMPGSVPRTFHVWKVADGEELRSFPDDTPWHGPVAISQQSKLVAVGAAPSRGNPAHISLWDLETGKPLPPIDLSKLDFYVNLAFLVFSPDGKFLAASGAGPIRIWELATRREVGQLATTDNGAACLAFSPSGRMLASGSTDTTALLWDLTGRIKNGTFQTTSLSTQDFQKHWDDLGASDPSKARPALWALVAAGDQSVELLQSRLHSATSSTPPEGIARLVLELNSPDYPVRAKASAELIKQAELAEPALLEAQKKHPTLELRRRIDDLLRLIADSRIKPSEDKLRAWRAVQVLEQINSPKARQFLQTLSDGAAAAILTREAKASLARLDRLTASVSSRTGQ